MPAFGFGFLFFGFVVLETESHYVAQAGLKHMTLLPQLLK
jgi:hypothetical protein